jgi:hypothetical protein
MKELTYENFKIGQIVTCVKFDDNDFWDQHLTIGKKYKIEDLDFHFLDSLCVKSDNGKTSMFMPIRFFHDEKYVRKLKLDKIKKSNDNK